METPERQGKDTCVGCHVPLVQDPDIAMQMPGGFEFIHIRDHYIRIPAR